MLPLITVKKIFIYGPFTQDVDSEKSPMSVDGAIAASSLFKIIVESHLKGTICCISI